MATYQQILAYGQLQQQNAIGLSGQMPDGSPLSTVQRVNAGFMALGQTAKQYVGKQATSTTLTTTVPLETVTAGKSYYISDVFIGSDVAQGATTIDVRIQAGGVDIFRMPVHNLSPIELPGIETQPFAAAGQQVNIVLPITTGVQQVWFTVLGFEQ